MPSHGTQSSWTEWNSTMSTLPPGGYARSIESPSNALPKISSEESLLQVLDETQDWKKIVEEVRSFTHNTLQNPLAVRIHKLDLPINIQKYTETQFLVSDLVLVGDQGDHEIQYGYIIKDEFRRVGRIKELVLDESGNVAKITAGTRQALQIFKDHIFGRVVTPSEEIRIQLINTTLINALREVPELDEKLTAFANKRGFPSGWTDVARFAYYHPKEFDIVAFGVSRGFSAEELYMAGWCTRSVDRCGVVIYKNPQEEVVLIPFISEDGESIVSKRSRLINPGPNDPKYRSDPKLRQLLWSPEVSRELYNTRLLKDIAGKPLVITEGEIKALWSTQATNIPTLGIIGITQLSDAMVKRIVAARPSSITIILDRDPHAQGLARFDENTDSQRAAYFMAKRFEQAGQDNVRVTIPDKIPGQGKVGLDDYLKFVGHDKARDALEKLIEKALSAEEFAKKFKLDPNFHDLVMRRQALKIALRNEGFSGARTGYTESPTSEYEKKIKAAEAFLIQIEQEYLRVLSQDYDGARRLAQPSINHYAILAGQVVNRAPYCEKCIIENNSGRSIPLKNFQSDIVVLFFCPRDTGRNIYDFHPKGILAQYSMQELRIAFNVGEYSPKLEGFVLKGEEILKLTKNHKKDFKTFALCAAVGNLAEIYPPDEFAYLNDVSLRVKRDFNWQKVVNIPLIITKPESKNRVVAIIDFPTWELEEKKWGVVGNSIRDLDRRRGVVYAFLRDVEYKEVKPKIHKVYKTLVASLSLDNLEQTVAHLAQFGITHDVVAASGARLVTPSEWETFGGAVRHKRLFNQTVQAGLLVDIGENRFGSPFIGPVIVLPLFNKDRQVTKFRVLPLNPEDHNSEVIVPSKRAVHSLHGPRSVTKAFDPYSEIFLSDQLADASGKTLYICSNELDAMILKSALTGDRGNEAQVIGLHNNHTLAFENLEKIRRVKPAQVVLVVDKNCPSRYDLLGESGAMALGREVYDFAEKFGFRTPTNPFNLRIVALSTAFLLQETNSANIDSLHQSVLKLIEPNGKSVLETLAQDFGLSIKRHASLGSWFLQCMEQIDRYLSTGDRSALFTSMESKEELLQKATDHYQGFKKGREGYPRKFDYFLKDIFGADCPTYEEMLTRKDRRD